MGTYLIIAAASVACGLIILLIRSPGAFRKLMGSAAAGFAALLAIDLSTGITGVSIAVSGWTLTAAGLLGLPGVISMLLIKLMFKV